MQHSRIGRCAVSTRDLRNNTHARLVCVLFRRWHFCSVVMHSSRQIAAGVDHRSLQQGFNL